METSRFVEKLNKVDGNVYVIEEEAHLTDGVYEAALEHDNINPATLAVFTGPKLTGERVQSYALSTPSLTPWKKVIRVYADVPVVFISYETDGDTVEAEDINRVQEDIVRTQEELNAEAERAVREEARLDGAVESERDRATAAEQFLKEGLTVETGRAQEVEAQLAEDLAAEASRAEGAEKVLTDSLASEAARAKAAEHALSDDLGNETARAQTAEKALTDNLAAEITRSKGAEKTLTDSLSAETTRAKAAEKANADGIASECTRALAKEAELQGNVDAHISTVAGELQALKAADTALDEKKADTATVNQELGNRYTKDQVFTKQEVLQKIGDLIGSAPDTLDTFKEIADALGNDPNFAATIMNELAGKVDKVSGKQLTSNDYSDSEKAVVADVNAKKHTHSNKSVIDKITQGLLDNWSTAYTHISDAVKHITAAERTSWTDAYNKRHEHGNKTVIDKVTQAMLDKLSGIAEGAEVNVQADWSVTDTGSDAFIKNKPASMPAKGGEADTALKFKTARTINGVAFDGSKNITIEADAPIKALTNESLDDIRTFGDYYAAGGNTVTNKPEGVQHFGLRVLRVASGYIGQELDVNSRKWSRMFNSSTNTWSSWVEFFTEENKPAWEDVMGKPGSFPPSSHTHTRAQITDFPTSMPASDVAAWAKAASKPTYGWTEITGKPAAFAPSSHTHPKSQISDMPTKLSQFTNDPGYITQADVDTSQNHTHANKTVLDKLTQAMLDKLAGIAEGANKYVHPTTSGNKHIPTGGTSGQFLKWSADGTAVWAADNNTTYIAFKAATAATAGGTGLVPAPAAGAQVKYLRGDGTWAAPEGTAYTHPNSGVTAGTYRSVTVNAQGHVTAGTNPTTLAGYGITDAAAKSHNHDGTYLKKGAMTWADLKGGG